MTNAGGNGGAQTGFLPGNTEGTATLTVNQPATPAGFSTPAQDTTISAKVVTQSFSICDGDPVGNNLQQTCSVSVGSNVGADLVVTLTSNDPARLKLAAHATDAGSGIITVTIPAGQSSATYYAQGFDSTGTATHTATADGYASKTGTIQFLPSGVVIQGPNGTFGFFATIPTPVNLTIATALLNADNSYYAVQPLAGGLSLNVTLNNSVPAYGTFPSSVTISGGSQSVIAQFVPVAPGNTTVSVVAPSGWSTPASRTSLIGFVSN